MSDVPAVPIANAAVTTADIAPETPTSPTTAESKNTEPGPVPYDRFKSVNEELKALKAAQAKAAKEAAAAEEARLAEQNEYKTLAEQRAARLAELEPLGEKVTKYEAALDGLLSEELKGVPEFVRPLLANLDKADQLAYIAKHRSSWARPAAPDINNGVSGNRASGLTDAEKQELAARYGVKAEYLP